MMIRLLTTIAVVFCLINCGSEKASDGVVNLPIEKIGFEGDPKAKKKSIALLDKVLKEQTSNSRTEHNAFYFKMLQIMFSRTL